MWAERKTERSGTKIGWSRASCGAGVAENYGARAERGAGVAERERSGERAESAAHSPLQPNISLH